MSVKPAAGGGGDEVIEEVVAAVVAAAAAATAAAAAATAAAAVVVVMAAVAVSVGHCTYSRRRLFTLGAICPFAVSRGCFLRLETLGRRLGRLGRLGSSCYFITFDHLIGAAYALLAVLILAHDGRRD